MNSRTYDIGFLASLGAVLTALVIASPLTAQEATLEPDRGISLELGAGSGALLGIWAPAAERRDVGIEVSARWTRRDGDGAEDRTRALAAALPLKRYLDADGSVVPFLLVGPFVSYTETRFPQTVGSTGSTRWDVGGRFGVGLDWFPTSRVSVGGHVGLQASYVHEGQGLRSAGDVVLGGGELTGFSVGTMASGIRVRPYFR